MARLPGRNRPSLLRHVRLAILFLLVLVVASVMGNRSLLRLYQMHRDRAALEREIEQLVTDQRAWLDEFWSQADIELRGDDQAQQALRWNLFQLAQASARTHEQGIAAKAVTGAGYDGHYFWDTEVYVLPFLAYVDPEAARKMIRFRWKMLYAARRRAHRARAETPRARDPL